MSSVCTDRSSSTRRIRGGSVDISESLTIEIVGWSEVGTKDHLKSPRVIQPRLYRAAFVPAVLAVVIAAFLATYSALLLRVGRREHSLADAWGAALLLLVLAMPFVLPWYALQEGLDWNLE